MTEREQSAVPIGGNLPIILVAIAAAAGCAICWRVAPDSFFKAWLAAVMFVWSISLGSLTFLLIFCLTGGRWGQAASPWLKLNTRLMPLVALLFIPWMIGIETIYPWANSAILQQFENTENRRWLYRMPFYVSRTVFYFVIWSSLGAMVAGWPWSRKPVFESNEAPQPMMVGGEAGAGLGLIAVLLTATCAGIDWVMSFDPFFTSTLFGAMIGIGAMLSAMSAAVAAVCFWKPLHDAAMDDKTIGDLSNMLLAFLMLWAYFSYAHFLIMWSGNLPNEVSFYAARTAGLWAWVSPLLSVGGFIVPFVCLLSHDFKRSPRKVGTLAVCLLVCRLLELWWMVLPASRGSSSAESYWSVVPTTVFVVAVYFTALTWMMRRAEKRDPSEGAR